MNLRILIQLVLNIALLLTLTTSYAGETEKRFYRPFSSSYGQDSAVVKTSVKGWCWEQSHVDKRADAWRCADNKKVYDPCFVKTYGDKSQLVCPQSPWNGQAVLIQLQQPLNESMMKELDMSRDYPWAIELSDGQKCEAIIGEKPIYDNMPIRYRCHNRAVLLGHLQRCKETWQMLYKNNGDVSTVDIKRVWF